MPTYQYKGYDIDSDHELTPEEWPLILSHIDSLPPKNLGQAPAVDLTSSAMQGLEAIEPSAPIQPQAKPSILDKLRAGGEVAGTTIAGMGVGTVAPFMALANKAIGQGSGDFEHDTASIINRNVPQPKSALGQKYMEKAMPVLDTLNAIAPGMIPQGPMVLPKRGLKIDPQVDAYRAAQEATIKPQVEGLPDVQLSNPQPIKGRSIPQIPAGEGMLIPGSEKLSPQGESTPLPVLPDQLKPLSEQYPSEIPIGAIEGGIHPDTTPLPKLLQGFDTKTINEKAVQRTPHVDNINGLEVPRNPHESTLSLDESGQPLPDKQESFAGTEDFPLRQEILQQPEISQAIDSFREESARLQSVIDNAIATRAVEKAKAELAVLQDNFAAGMKELGIDNAADAHGLNRPLYEGGTSTKLPIQKAGFFKKQGGYVNPDVFKEGFTKTKNNLGKTYKLVAKTVGDIVRVAAVDKKTGKEIGAVKFGQIEGNATAHSVLVDIENQGKGVATDMYKFGQELGMDIQPDQWQTPKGKGLWQGFKDKGMVEDGVLPAKKAFLDGLENTLGAVPKSIESAKEQLQAKLDDAMSRRDSMMVGSYQAKLATANKLGGVGKAGFGQGGAIGFVKKQPTLEQYIKALSNKLGEEADPAIAKQMYEKEHPGLTDAAKAKTAVTKIPGLKQEISKLESRDPIDITGSISRMEDIGYKDLPEPAGAVFRNVLPAGRLQSWALKSPIVHEGIAFVTSVKDASRIKTANILSDITAGLNFFEKGISKFSEHSWKDAAEVFEIRRANEFNKEFKPESVLSGKKLELFNKIDKTLKDTYQEVNARRKELNPEAKDLKQLPYYFTSFFRGDWQIPVLGRDGEFLFNLRETSKANAEAAAKWARENGTSVGEIGLHRTSKWADRRIDARTDFEQLQDLFESDDPIIQQALDRMTGFADKSAMNTSGMPNRFKTKQGVVGSLGDRPWRTEKENFNDNKKALEMYITGAQDWLANTQISRWSKAMNNSEKIQALNAKKFLNDYSDYITGNKEDFLHVSKNFAAGMTELASKVPVVGKHVADYSQLKNGLQTLANVNTGFFVGYYSLRMVTQNAIQPFVATLPMMTKLSNVEGIKGNQMLAIPMGTMKGIIDQAQLIFNGKLGISESAKYKKDNHIVDMHLVEASKMFDNYHANQAYDLIANASVKVSEHWARNIAFSIYEEYLKSAGLGDAKSLDIAKNLTHETMVNYEQYAKSQVFGRSGVVGEMAGRLQTYKMNSLGQMTMYASDIKAKSPKTWVPMAQSIMIMLATAGAIGFIGMDVAELVWQAIQGADNSVGEQNDWIQENTPKRWIYNNTPEMLSMGALSVTTGANLSGAFSQNLVGNNPAASLFPVLGQTGEQLKAPFNLMSSNSINKARGLQAITPNTAKRFIEKEYLSKEDDKGNTTVVSPLSGNPVYHGKGQGYIDETLANIQTLERGKQSTENYLHRQFAKNVSDSEKALQEKAEKITWDFSKGSITKAELQQRLKPLIAHADDPNSIINSVTASAEKYGVGDSITSELLKGITLGNRKSFMDASRINAERQKRN